MLTRCVFTVWGTWLGAIGLAAAPTASGIWKTNPILAVGLAVLMAAGGRRPRRSSTGTGWRSSSAGSA